MKTEYEQIVFQLKEKASEDAAPMAAYMRNEFPFLGIKSAARRNITSPFFKKEKARARRLFKTNPETEIIDWALVDILWKQEEREYQYAAADYLKEMKQYLKKEDLKKIGGLITAKSWWDSVDMLVKTAGNLAAKHPELKENLIEWSVSDNIWLRRTAIINQLNMKEKTDTELLKKTIENNLNQDEFFINKAIGWALRDYAKTDPDWVKNFLSQHQENLSPLSLREAGKHLVIE